MQGHRRIQFGLAGTEHLSLYVYKVGMWLRKRKAGT